MTQFDTLIPGIRRTSLLTLISLGLILIGTFASTKLISSNSQSRSKAAEQNVQIQSDSCGTYRQPTGTIEAVQDANSKLRFNYDSS